MLTSSVEDSGFAVTAGGISRDRDSIRVRRVEVVLEACLSPLREAVSDFNPTEVTTLTNLLVVGLTSRLRIREEV